MSLLRSPGQTTNGTGEHDITKRLSSSSASTIVYTPGTQLMEPAYRLRSGSVYYPSRHHETQHLDRLIRSSSFFLTVLAILQRTPLSSKKCQIPGVPMISHLLYNLIHSSSTLAHSPVRTTFPLPPPGGGTIKSISMVRGPILLQFLELGSHSSLRNIESISRLVVESRILRIKWLLSFRDFWCRSAAFHRQ